MRLTIAFAIAAALVLSSAAGAQSSIATNYNVFNNWIPVIIIASTLAVLLASIYYMIGWLLNNNRVKASAISELQHAGASILIVVLLVWFFFLIGTSSSISFSSILGSGGTSQINNICNNILPNSQISTFNSVYQDNAQNLPGPTTAVCKYLIDSNAGVTPVTRQIDYGLASTYVVFANMSNQSAMELNSLYNFDSLLFFLRNLRPFIVVCIPAECDLPVPDVVPTLKLSYNPYGGYVLQRAIMPAITTEGTIALYMFVIQMVLILIVLMGWPYLLAGGIVLRTIPFTRRIGGLLIAATVVAVVIYPTVFLFEYSSLSNLNPNSFIGASSIPAVSLCGFGQLANSAGNNVLYCYTSADSLKTSYILKGLTPAKGTATTLNACSSVSQGEQPFISGGNPFSTAATCYVKRNINFYVYPYAGDVINLYSCNIQAGATTIWPFESEALAQTLVQEISLPVTFILSFFTGISPLSSPLGLLTANNGACVARIGPYNIAAALSALANMYGIIAVSAFIIPIINVLMMISAMVGISSLMGGETTIIGLSRFI